jgi:hypothetical protein
MGTTTLGTLSTALFPARTHASPIVRVDVGAGSLLQSAGRSASSRIATRESSKSTRTAENAGRTPIGRCTSVSTSASESVAEA